MEYMKIYLDRVQSILYIVSPLGKHGCFKLSVKMLLLQPCTLMEEEEEYCDLLILESGVKI